MGPNDQPRESAIQRVPGPSPAPVLLPHRDRPRRPVPSLAKPLPSDRISIVWLLTGVFLVGSAGLLLIHMAEPSQRSLTLVPAGNVSSGGEDQQASGAGGVPVRLAVQEVEPQNGSGMLSFSSGTDRQELSGEVRRLRERLDVLEARSQARNPGTRSLVD